MSHHFAIIGGGAAGCLLAWRLSRAMPDASILLVEAGSPRPDLLNRIPLLSGFAPLRSGTRYVHHANGPAGLQYLLQGRMLGGSSFINGMVISHGAQEDYRLWEQAAGPLWSWENCAQAFADIHKTAGLPNTKTQSFGPLSDAFLAGAAALGLPVVEDLNKTCGERFGLTHINTAQGRRVVSADLLHKLPNLSVLTTPIRRLQIDQGKITHLVTESGTKITVAGEVILTCGAVETTRLLFASGIGPADALRRSGVRVVLDHPEIGQNLQNHPSFSLKCPTDGGSLADLMRPRHAIPAGLNYLLRRKGPLAQGLFQAAGYFSIEEGGEAAAQCILSPAILPNLSDAWHQRLPRRHGFTIAVQQGRPQSRGKIGLAEGRLVIDTAAYSDPYDVEFMVKATARVADIIAAGPLAAHLRGPVELPSAQVIRRQSGTAYHMAGTVRMGQSEDAPTAPDLRLRGIAGLRIADASVMPVIPNAALHFPSMMIAMRAADFITAATS